MEWILGGVLHISLSAYCVNLLCTWLEAELDEKCYRLATLCVQHIPRTNHAGHHASERPRALAGFHLSPLRLDEVDDGLLDQARKAGKIVIVG
jgi:hypothetical protein